MFGISKIGLKTAENVWKILKKLISNFRKFDLKNWLKFGENGLKIWNFENLAWKMTVILKNLSKKELVIQEIWLKNSQKFEKSA